MKKTICIILAAVLLLGALSAVLLKTQTPDGTEKYAAQTAAYLKKSVPAPTVSPIGGEWLMLGLARSEKGVPDSMKTAYLSAAEKTVSETKGILHDKKSTENSRVILALTALGENAQDFAGCDLTLPLADFEKTQAQGLNGPIWALIALDSGNYEIPENKAAETQATRQMYVEHILSCQNQNGGFSLQGNTQDTDADLTAMALTALSTYQNQPSVKEATERALACLSALQQEDGGFGAWGAENAESAAQVLMALSALGISYDDERFTKSGGNVLDALLSFRNPDGSFCHLAGGNADLMATEQGYYALIAVLRMQKGESPLCQIVSKQPHCTISISCEQILSNMDKLDPDKTELVPSDGVLLAPTVVAFTEGESVFDVLQRVCTERKLHLEFSQTPMYQSAYIEGIGNLYEFDCGELSGWMYSVNDWYPNYGSSRYTLQDGDTVCWRYTCDLGADIGGEGAFDGT